MDVPQILQTDCAFGIGGDSTEVEWQRLGRVINGMEPHLYRLLMSSREVQPIQRTNINRPQSQVYSDKEPPYEVVVADPRYLANLDNIARQDSTAVYV